MTSLSTSSSSLSKLIKKRLKAHSHVISYHQLTPKHQTQHAMYGYNTNDLSGDFQSHFPVPDDTTPSTFPPSSLAPFPPNSLVIPNNELDSLSTLMKQEFCYTSSGCSSYGSPSSLTSYGPQTSSLMQRSVSSHSLQKNVNGFQFHQPTAELLDSGSGTVRKAFSTGDLERINMVQQYYINHQSESPLSNESSIIEGIINTKACPYSPEEKKERIKRYRSKRNQRNFNKKIKYVCRKTLADSRPRIRGRFARNNGENEKAPQNEWNQMSGLIGDEEDLDQDYDQDWVNVLNAFSANLIP